MRLQFDIRHIYYLILLWISACAVCTFRFVSFYSSPISLPYRSALFNTADVLIKYAMGCIARNVSFLGFFFAFYLIVMQYKYKNLWTVNGPRRREEDIPNIFRHLMHRLKIHVNVCCICFGSFYCCHWLFAIHILFMLSECNIPVMIHSTPSLL